MSKQLVTVCLWPLHHSNNTPMIKHSDESFLFSLFGASVWKDVSSVWLTGLGAAQCEFFSTTTSMCGSWLEAKLPILVHTF